MSREAFETGLRKRLAGIVGVTPDELPPIVSKAHGAAFIGVGPRTIDNWNSANMNGIVSFRCGRHTKLSTDWLIEYFLRQYDEQHAA